MFLAPCGRTPITLKAKVLPPTGLKEQNRKVVSIKGTGKDRPEERRAVSSHRRLQGVTARQPREPAQAGGLHVGLVGTTQCFKELKIAAKIEN